MKLTLGFAIAFAVCAAVQINDPDPIRWIALYGAATLVCIANVLGRAPALAHTALGAVAAIWAATLLPQVLGEAAFTGNEVERELGGVLLVSFGMFHVHRSSRRAATPVIE